MFLGIKVPHTVVVQICLCIKLFAVEEVSCPIRRETRGTHFQALELWVVGCKDIEKNSVDAMF